jgi:nucleotide-binding universal stress UspA family protein
MSIKSILTVFGGNADELNALESSLSLAQACRSFVRILHIAAPPVPTDFSGLGLTGAVAYLDASTIEALDEADSDLAARAGDYAKARCQNRAVVLQRDGSDIVMGQFQVAFRTVVGKVRQCLVEQAIFADLIVTGYDNRADGDLDTVLVGLLEAGRPVLALPRNPSANLPETGLAKNVVFAWDGSRASSRALREAVPHMLHAANVFVVHVADAGDEARGETRYDLMTYLRSHCISATYVQIDRNDRWTGDVILHEAHKLDADLLILGAYGHGHLSEMLLGGVTDHVLKHADLPLLLVH